MELQQIIQLATLGTMICGICGVLVAINGYRRQINARLLTEYANRYDELVQSFPGHSWANRFDESIPIPPASKELTLCVVRFLRFLDGAYFMYRHGYLEKHAWNMWQDEITRTMQTPLFRREIAAAEPNLIMSPEFRRYVLRVVG